VNKQLEEKVANASKSLVAGAIGKIQAKENKNIANASKSLVADAIGKIQVNEKNTVREGVEFKIKQVKGLTNANVAEFMKKWNTSKNKTIFNQARKRGAGRLAGKAKTEERGKNKADDDEAETEATRLFNVGSGVKNLTRGKEERDVNKNVLEKTRKLVGFGIGGKAREKFLTRGRGMQNTRPLVKELDERLALINTVKNFPNRKELEKRIQNSNTTINRVRALVKASQNKRNKNIENASKSLVADVKAKENKNIENASKSLVAGAIEKATKNETIRQGVEFKIKQIEGLTNADVKEFMNKWNKSKNKTIFNQARKRGAGRLAGKSKTEERAKEGADTNNGEATRLFNAGGGVKNLTRGKNERDVNKNVLERTRKLVGFGIGGKAREKFLTRGRGMPNTAPLVKELDERLALINKVKNRANRKELEKLIRNSNTTINRVRAAVNAKETTIVNPLFEPEPENFKVNPLFEESKPSFRALVQKNKEKRVVNAVKLAGKKVAVSQATGPERVRLARNLAPTTQKNVKKANNAVKLLVPKVEPVKPKVDPKARNNKFIKTGVTQVGTNKAQARRNELAARKAAKKAETQKTLNARKNKVEALKAAKAAKVNETDIFSEVPLKPRVSPIKKRGDLEKVEPPKVEPVKPKVEPPKVEPPKVEPPKVEPVKPKVDPKVRNNKFIKTGVTQVGTNKAQARRNELAARKAAKKAEVQKTLNARKKKVEALKAAKAAKVNETDIFSEVPLKPRVSPIKKRGDLEKVGTNKAEAAKVEPVKPVESNINRIKRTGAAAEAKRKAKAELRKKNREVAKATGKGVKSTQKKQQLKRK
jgi:hypothetical protein